MLGRSLIRTFTRHLPQFTCEAFSIRTVLNVEIMTAMAVAAPCRNSSKGNSAVAWRGSGGPARAAQIRPACRLPDDVPPGSSGSTPLRLADRAVVVVLQSRALVGARRRHRVDGCCIVDDIASGSPVHCGRYGFRPAGVHRTCARPRAGRRSGRLSCRDTAVGADGRVHRSRLRRVHARCGPTA